MVAVVAVLKESIGLGVVVSELRGAEGEMEVAGVKVEVEVEVSAPHWEVKLEELVLWAPKLVVERVM